jgi:hypothetical protein
MATASLAVLLVFLPSLHGVPGVLWKSALLTATAFVEGALAIVLLGLAQAWIRGPWREKCASVKLWFRASALANKALWTDLVRLAFALWIVLTVYFLVKTSIHALNPRVFDGWLWRSDQWLGMGHDPKQMALRLFAWPPLLHALDVIYSVVYPFLFTFTPPVLALLSPTRALRVGALTGFSLLWVLGGALYVAFPSWGPVYTRPSQFEGALQSMPITVYVQKELFEELKGVIQRPAGPRPIRFGGVAAFPSLHLAVVTLFTLAFRPIGRWWFRAGLAISVAMVAGSLVTGYHYLLDALAGIVLGAACYLAALAWANRWLGPELRESDGRLSIERTRGPR